MPFLCSKANQRVNKQPWKIADRSLQIKFPHNFSLRILILSWPFALFRSRFWIFLKIWPDVYFKEDKGFYVKMLRLTGNKLLLFIKECCLPKKVLESPAFSLKSVANLLSRKRGGMNRIFCYLKNVWVTISRFQNVFLLCITTFE